MMPAATCPLSARDGPGIAITAIAIVPNVTITAEVLVMPGPSLHQNIDDQRCV
jgi:hypothetical protein